MWLHEWHKIARAQGSGGSHSAGGRRRHARAALDPYLHESRQILRGAVHWWSHVSSAVLHHTQHECQILGIGQMDDISVGLGVHDLDRGGGPGSYKGLSREMSASAERTLARSKAKCTSHRWLCVVIEGWTTKHLQVAAALIVSTVTVVAWNFGREKAAANLILVPHNKSQNTWNSGRECVSWVSSHTACSSAAVPLEATAATLQRLIMAFVRRCH